MRIKLAAIFLLILCFPVFATTWDEPWQDEVIKNADSFVFAKINSFNKKTGINLTITKTISGRQLSGKIKITDFYLLNFTSYSGDGGGFFHFEGAKEGYFFVKQNQKGKFCIATPTAGFAILHNGLVYATYRYSYHQALVPPDIYEKTMTAIFNNYHNQPYDGDFINQFVKKYIVQKPAGINTSENELFFFQHAALETLYHLRLSGYYSETLPFLSPDSNFHAQVSAARALISYNTDQCKSELLSIINAKNREDFVQVISIWTLSEFWPVELKSKLMDLEKTASTKANGFGGNIMDPRVGTYFPDVKTAIQNLIKTL